ncbi:MAG: peptidoglycan-binding domain-containing protein [Anaerolineae bacterium]
MSLVGGNPGTPGKRAPYNARPNYVPRPVESGDGGELTQMQIQHPQRSIGNRSVGYLLAHGQQALKVQRTPLTAEEQALNLQSPRYASNDTLQNAYDNNPPLRQGASGEAVVLVQQGTIDAGFPLPLSTNNGTEPLDGVYGPETAGAVRQLRGKTDLTVTAWWANRR